MTTMEFNTQLLNLDDPLRRYALVLSSNKDDANDLVQETYLRALNNKNKFLEHQENNIKSWTFTIMKNIFINNYRRKKSQKDKLENVSEENSSLFADRFENNFVELLQIEEMNKNIEKLDSHLKDPLRLHLSGFKYKEIANMLTLNIGTVKSRLFFARTNLKKMIKDLV